MFNNLSLKWKINLIMVLIILIIVTVIAYIIYNFTTDIVLEEINDKIDIMTGNQEDLLNLVISRRKEEIERIPNHSMVSLYSDFAYYQYQFNNEEREVFSDLDISSFNELISSSNLVLQIGNTLRKEKNKIKHARLAYITNPEGIVIADSRYYYSAENRKEFTGIELEEDMYKKASAGNLKRVNGEPLVLLNVPIKHNTKLVGYLVVGFSTDLFKENVDTTLGKYGRITLVNDKGIILNNNEENVIGQRISNESYLKALEEKADRKKIINKDVYHILNKIEDQNLYLAIDIPLSQINAPGARIRNIILIIFLIGSFVIFLILYFTINWQLSPIDFILNKMNKVSNGDMEAKVNIDRNDEIGELAQKFNEMVDNIKKLLQKVKSDQEEIRKKEFQSLQAQINPHFLYNSLDFINWMTQTEEYDGIERMVIALSRFFRLSLNKGKDITTIKKEIEHVKNYLVIQELRYPNKFDYDIKVAPQIYNNECIKLILQPIVENSLNHGLEDINKGGLIEITGKKQGENIILKVCDNGRGFDVEKMNDYISDEDNDKGYGLKNVHKRIQLYYGERYGLSFSINEDGGACVMVLLPEK